MTGSTIYSTKKYDDFKIIKGNREIFQPHLSRLIKSIGEKNLLPQNPIIVNESMEVIDGQHRLKAAQALGLEIYYTIADGQHLMAVQLLNANNRAWSTDDYLSSYVALGNKEYMSLKEFSEEYKISVPIALVILSDTYTTHDAVLRAYRDGKFVVKDMAKAENMAPVLVGLRRFSPDNAWADRRCMQAVNEFIATNDPKKLIKQLEDYSLLFTKRYSKSEYLIEFQDILNFAK